MASELGTTFLPSIFVPMIGILVPAVSIILIGKLITATE